MSMILLIRVSRVRVPDGAPKIKASTLWVLLFFAPVIGRDSNPERARTVKSNSPGDCLIGEWCEARYRSSKSLGGRAGQMRSICVVPDGAPLKGIHSSECFFVLSL